VMTLYPFGGVHGLATNSQLGFMPPAASRTGASAYMALAASLRIMSNCARLQSHDPDTPLPLSRVRSLPRRGGSLAVPQPLRAGRRKAALRGLWPHDTGSQPLVRHDRAGAQGRAGAAPTFQISRSHLKGWQGRSIFP